MITVRYAWGTAVAACLPALAAAPGAPTPAPTSAPALSYSSAFTDYKPYRDVPLANWREVNAAVTGERMGMAMPEAPAVSATPTAKSKPATAMPEHGTHRHGPHHNGGKP